MKPDLVRLKSAQGFDASAGLVECARRSERVQNSGPTLDRQPNVEARSSPSALSLFRTPFSMSTESIPSTMRALTLHKSDCKPGPGCYHPTSLSEIPTPSPQPGQVLLKIITAGFNHKDLYTRQSLYPGIVFSSEQQPAILGADCAGLVQGPASHALLGKRVILNPTVGWIDNEDGPESAGFSNYGATKGVQGRGTFAEFICVDEKDVVEVPDGLSWEEAGVLGLGGTTAWRAVKTKAGVREGWNVLVTGVGGGVALLAVGLCVAMGKPRDAKRS